MREHLPPGSRLRALGEHRLKDLPDHEDVFELVLPGREAPLGSPGGSMRVGNVEADTPRIAALPPNPDVEA